MAMLAGLGVIQRLDFGGFIRAFQAIAAEILFLIETLEGRR